jgi:hypothetical protein
MANQETTTTIYASFYSNTNYASNAQLPAAGLALKPLSISIDESKSEVPSFSAEFSFTAPEFSGSYKWSDYIRKGRRVTFYAYHHYDSPFTQIPLGTFIIDDIAKNFSAGGKTLTISGPGLMQELVDKLLFYPIGVYKTNLAYIAVAAPGPTNTTLSLPANVGAETITVSSAAGWAVPDEVRITMNDFTKFPKGYHLTNIKEVNGNVVTLETKIPGAAAQGNNVQFRKRRIALDSAALFYEGDVIKIKRNTPNNLLHDGYLIEELEGNAVTLSRGLLDAASVGNYVQREDYSEPTASDITTALAGWNILTPWSATIEANRPGKTAMGTKGSSIFSILKQISDIHGEYFISDSMTSIAAGDAISLLPKRKIIWRHTCRESGIKLVQPSSIADAGTIFADKTKAIILNVTDRIPRPIVDILYVKGAGAGANQISLADCNQTTINHISTTYGFVLQGEEGDIYKPYKLTAPFANAYRESILNIDVLPEDGSPESVQSVANMMLRQAAAHLKVISSDAREFQVQAIGRVLIRAGDIVRMDYAHDDFGVTFTDHPMQVISVSTEVTNEGIFYDMVLSTSTIPNEAPSRPMKPSFPGRSWPSRTCARPLTPCRLRATCGPAPISGPPCPRRPEAAPPTWPATVSPSTATPSRSTRRP